MKPVDNYEGEKSIWVTPKLTVLVRNKPEENILGTCKGDSFPAVTSNSNASACQATIPACFECTTIADS